MLEAAALALAADVRWMAHNLVLAAIPLALLLIATAPSRRDSLRRGLAVSAAVAMVGVPVLAAGHARFVAVAGAVLLLTVLVASPYRGVRLGARSLIVGAAVLFLPNAPYVLTDGLHIVTNYQQTGTHWLMAALSPPLFAGFILVGVAAYVASLRIMRERVAAMHGAAAGVAVVWLAHAASAVGIYLGRIERFHSWHAVTATDTFVEAVREQATQPLVAAFVVGVFVCIAAASLLVERWLFQRDEVMDASSLARRLLHGWLLGSAALFLALPVPSLLHADVSSPSVAVLGASIGAGVGLVAGAWSARRRAVGSEHRRLDAARTLSGTLAAVALVGGISMAAFTAMTWAGHEGGVPRSSASGSLFAEESSAE